MQEYDHKKIEKKWQKYWEEEKINKTADQVKGKDNEYVLVEFPYPSGNLHVGHWYAFSVTDIYAKFRRLVGKNVLFPIGFDAFGLPAENAAIKRKLDPKKWTYSNMATMKEQMKSMGASFDWDREVITCDPEYYRWTQWIFSKMFAKGLAYKKKAVVNWDPVDKTVLANEQVMPDGTAERSGAVVEKKEIDQWFLKITDYADRLVDGLEKLDWPEQIKEMQRNWIGRSFGAEINFRVKDSKELISVFTTRVDTIFGVTYLVISPEHNLVQRLSKNCSNKKEILEYINLAKQKNEIDRLATNKEKTGIKLENVFAINPANGDEVPVYIADYVLAGYGTGAVMAVPAHDERDHVFALKYGLPIKPVIAKQGQSSDNIPSDTCYIDDGILINSGEFNGLNSDKARIEITKKLGAKNKKTFKLRDWSVGRQRYWGCPVPIVYDPNGKPHAVPEDKLPWLLPEDVDHTPTGEPPLAKSKELLKRTEKIFGKGWTPEVETLDTFIDSSWYFLRYLDSKNKNDLASSEKIGKWMPVNFYSGGSEHTTLHLLYSRFFYKVLFDLGIVREDEPYQKRLNRGLILGPDGNKMSKSKGNVIDPDELVEKLGADTVRLYLAFIGPYNESGSYPWDTNGVVGVRRFLERVWRISQNNIADESSPEIKIEINKLIQKATRDYGNLKMNTVVAAMMSFLNVVDKNKISKSDFENFLIVLAPSAPHISEEIWHALGNKKSIIESKWPEFDQTILDTQKVTIGVQINGKVRGEIEISREEEEENVKKRALKMPEIDKWVKGQEVKKVIYLKGKIINIVISG